MSNYAHKLRMAARPNAYIEAVMLEEAADHIEKLEAIILDKLDRLHITSPPAKRGRPPKQQQDKDNT